MSPSLQANSKKGSFQNPFVNNKRGKLIIWLIPNTLLNSTRREGSRGCCVTNLLEAARSCSSCARHPSAGVCLHPFLLPVHRTCTPVLLRAVNPSPCRPAGRDWHSWAGWLSEDIRVLEHHWLPTKCLLDPQVSDTAQHGFSSPCVAVFRNQVN